MNDFPRDLLKRFTSVNHHHHHEQQQQHRHGDGDTEQEIELSLGLSMNGHFGVDTTAKKIKITSSILEFSFPKPLIRDEDNNNSNNNNQDIGGYSNNMLMPCTTNLIRT
ncbi:hypothetical protein Ahy_A09g045633 [Arachis hypogaea]|uniref:Ethylene-responsive binding factor-associated repression domain-containing protein n=1 Tax=Arachis hypogaea TaxID=3818 RepID=A0A445BMW4_ARAHY|nr:hypothetical protein Ahy_A09g045633 [Arachis hypogaea]